MGGNVWEWNALTDAASASRGLRGSSWASVESYLSSSGRVAVDPSGEYYDGGIRLASPVAVPEPSTWAIGLAGIACGCWRMWRRKRRI